MLSLVKDHQDYAKSGSLQPSARAAVWKRGEEYALAARELNPYNPDHTGNLGLELLRAADEERAADPFAAWALGHALAFGGRHEAARDALERCVLLGDGSARTGKELARELPANRGHRTRWKRFFAEREMP